MPPPGGGRPKTCARVGSIVKERRRTGHKARQMDCRRSSVHSAKRRSFEANRSNRYSRRKRVIWSEHPVLSKPLMLCGISERIDLSVAEQRAAMGGEKGRAQL